jgi:hypothetical protein
VGENVELYGTTFDASAGISPRAANSSTQIA